MGAFYTGPSYTPIPLQNQFALATGLANKRMNISLETRPLLHREEEGSRYVPTFEFSAAMTMIKFYATYRAVVCHDDHMS